MHTVRQWLERLGLSQYAEVFERNHLGWELLETLTNQDLLEVGIESLGHRKKLLGAIAELRGYATPATSGVPPARDVRSRSAESAAGATSDLPGERRQLTVLFCDMVGFTDLASRVDPEVLQGIVAATKTLRGGRHTVRGLRLPAAGRWHRRLLWLPAGTRSEAERAIRAGLEIIAALSMLDVPEVGHLAVRIGIATGMVVVSSARKALSANHEPRSKAASYRTARHHCGERAGAPARRRRFRLRGSRRAELEGIGTRAHVYRIPGSSQAASRFEAATGATLTPLGDASRKSVCCSSVGISPVTAKGRWCCCLASLASASPGC